MPGSRAIEILKLLGNGRADGGSLPERLCQECVLAVPVSGAGLALTTAEGVNGVLVATTAGAARHLGELQFSLGEGPCVDATHTGGPVLQPQLSGPRANRWPAFEAAALGAGVHAVFAFPLQVGAIRMGVLGLYRDAPGRLADGELAEALAFADVATLILLHLQDSSTGNRMHPALSEPLDRVARVHQATGMVSVQLGVSLAAALLRLRAHAYAHDRPVAAIAADVVDRRMRFDDSEAGYSTESPR